MLDLQRMFQHGNQANSPQTMQGGPGYQGYQPDQLAGSSWKNGGRLGGWQQPSFTSLFNWFPHLWNNDPGRSQYPTPSPPASPATSASTLAPAYVGESPSFTGDPFGMSLNNGTLGAMLARQPGVY